MRIPFSRYRTRASAYAALALFISQGIVVEADCPIVQPDGPSWVITVIGEF